MGPQRLLLTGEIQMKTEAQIVEAYKATETQVTQAWQNVADSGLDYTQNTQEVMDMFESSLEAITSQAIFGTLESCYCDLVHTTCSYCNKDE